MDNRIFQLLTVLAISGCSSMSGIPDRTTDVETELASLKSYFDPTVVTNYQSKPSDTEKKGYRDEVISARLRAIDLNFNEFVKDISSEQKGLNIGSDSTVLLLGAAGAVSTVSSTQAILSATSATVTGVKASIDKNAYYDTTLTALVSQMQANRQKVLVNIYLGMEMDIKEYSLMRALVDIENYFQAGTIIGAVNEINKEAGKQKSEADNELSDIVKGKYKKDKAGDTLRSFWKPDGKTVDSTNEAQLKSWMSSNGIDNTSITMFLRAEHFSDARVKAVADLGI